MGNKVTIKFHDAELEGIDIESSATSGLFKGKDGHVYIGEFRDGLPHGLGVGRCPDGRERRVRYDKGKLTGPGVNIDKAGLDYYIGNYLNDERDGYGEQCDSQGVYRGQFVSGKKRCGKGRFISQDGTIRDSIWDNDHDTGVMCDVSTILPLVDKGMELSSICIFLIN